MRDECECVLLQVGAREQRHQCGCGHRGLLWQLPGVPQVCKSGSEKVWSVLWNVCSLPCAGLVPPTISGHCTALLPAHLAAPSSVCTLGGAGLHGAEQLREVWEHPSLAPSFPPPQPGAHWQQTRIIAFWLGPCDSGNYQERCLGLCRVSLIPREAISPPVPGQSRWLCTFNVFLSFFFFFSGIVPCEELIFF